jgi:bacterioferritin
MKGSKKVIEVLNDVLAAELVGINQYFLHSKMCKNWGFERIAAVDHHESVDEMKHASALVERILFLEGVPNLQKLGRVRIGQTVPEQLALDLALEVDAVARLNRGIGVCVAERDNTSRELLEEIVKSEEQHLDWLETQLTLVKQLGEKTYLAEQLHK